MLLVGALHGYNIVLLKLRLYRLKHMSKENAQILSRELAMKSEVEVLKELASRYAGRVVFTTSFGIEDQVISHLIFSNNIDIRVATIDTGRLFRETYKVFDQTIERYGKRIECFFPHHGGVESMVSGCGPNGFYQSVEKRKLCCEVRKVEPLRRLLSGVELWVTGIRADQSDNRTSMDLFMWDDKVGSVKYNPLLRWTYEQCREFVLANDVPFNSLHDRGFVSIGCEPCTRAITPGEDFRAGRWWWEDKSKKECGLHT